MSAITGMPRAAYTPLGTKVLNQLFFQHSSRLYQQAAINRFVGHALSITSTVTGVTAVAVAIRSGCPASYISSTENVSPTPR
jgi:hypothetical protein